MKPSKKIVSYNHCFPKGTFAQGRHKTLVTLKTTHDLHELVVHKLKSICKRPDDGSHNRVIDAYREEWTDRELYHAGYTNQNGSIKTLFPPGVRY